MPEIARPLNMPECRYPLVDSIRGVSILLVLILHFHLAYRLTEGFFADFVPKWLLGPLVRNGNYGVVMFFVVSGFLITSRTMARFGELRNVSFRNFYSFRVARIIPNIALMLSLVVLFSLLGIRIFQNDHPEPSMFLTILSVLTFTHNLLMEKFGYFNYCLNILWSLSVEEIFYLAFPLVCFFCRRQRFVIATWSIFIVVSPIYRFHHRGDETDIFGLYDYLACFDGIAIGCIAAILRRNLSIPSWLSNFWYLFAAIIAFIYFRQGIWSNLVFGISGISLSVGAILFLMPRSIRESQSRFTPLQWIGKYSYELYLFHIIILALLKSAISKSSVGYFEKPFLLAAFLFISVAVAIFISRYFSEPLNKAVRALLDSPKQNYAVFAVDEPQAELT